MIFSDFDIFLMQSLQLTSAEDCSESSLADTQTPKSKNGNQKIDVEDQRSVLKRIKAERKKLLFSWLNVVEFNYSAYFGLILLFATFVVSYF